MVNLNLGGNGGSGNGNSDNGQAYPPVHYLHELPQADEERLERIFKKLDRDGNGRIDIHDLSAALKEFGLSHQYAEEYGHSLFFQRFLKQSDQTESGDVGLAEFIHYVREHEKNLRLQFTHLDKNKDGKVDLDELILAFKELGVEIDNQEAAKLLKRMDKDGSLNIDYDEWRDFLLLAPSSDLHELVKYWRHSTTLRGMYLYALGEPNHRLARLHRCSTSVSSSTRASVDRTAP